MPTDLFFYLVGLPAVFIIALGKGAFGGGLAILGVPLLALAVDPLTASIMMAPIVSATDPFGIWAYPPRTWSWPDLAWLTPGTVVGLGLGAMFFVTIDPRIVALAIAVVTLWFTARWFLTAQDAPQETEPVAPVKALACGTLAGFTTFIAHGGNPPIAFYLLPRGLSKTVYAGTMIALFTVSNTVKLILYFGLAAHQPQTLLRAVALMPAIPAGVWLGKKLNDRMNEYWLYFCCYALIGIAGLKLLIDNIKLLMP